jgi:hypothetical protein
MTERREPERAKYQIIHRIEVHMTKYNVVLSRHGLLISVIVASLAASLVILLSDNSTQSSSSQPILMGLDGYIGSKPLDAVAAEATFIFEGTARQSGDPFWTTPDKKRPNKSLREITFDPSIAIVTPYSISVDKVLKGAIDSETIDYLQAGGSVGEDEMFMPDGLVWIEHGTHAIFFIKERSTGESINKYKILDRYEYSPSTNELIGRTRTATLDEIRSLIAE